MFTEDLDAFMADFGVPVTFTGAPAGLQCLEDFVDVGELDNDGRATVLGRRRTITVRTDAVTTVRINDTLTVNGTSRKVLDPRAQDDGAFTTMVVK